MNNHNEPPNSKLCSVVTFIIIGIIVVVNLPFDVYLKIFLEWTKGQGFIGVIIFILVYIVSTVCFLPGVILTIAAGFIYGTIVGTIYVEIGATVGAQFSFLLGKALFREWVLKMVENYPMFSAIDKAISLNSWKIVTLLRLSPLTPYNVLNYGLALTRIKFWDYTWTNLIGMLPSTILFTYMGTAAKNINDIVSRDDADKTEKNPMEQVLFYIGLILTLISVVLITIISGRAIKEELREAELKKIEKRVLIPKPAMVV